MSNGNDGAHLALAGYLYQIVGEWGLLAKAYDKLSPDGQGLATLLAFTKGANAFHEPAGQDFGMEGLGTGGKYERKFVQFKYSTQPSDNPIQPKELLEIAQRFRASEEVANKLAKLSTGYVLITNRDWSSEAPAFIKAAKNDEPHRLFGRARAKKAERAIIKELSRYQIDENEWASSLRKYSHRLGLTDTEFSAGINRLIARLVTDSAKIQSRPISKEDLDEELAGFPSPNLLTRAGIQNKIRLNIEQFKAGARTPSDLLRRQIIDEIEVATDSAIVIVCGEGGTGKSAALCKSLEELAPNNTVPKQYVAAEFAADLPKHWFGEVVAKWRNCPPDKLHTDSPQVSLLRLSNAHGDHSRPIMVLAIDGFDELRVTDLERNTYARSLIAFIWEQFVEEQRQPLPPKLILLATCREHKDVYQLLPQWGQQSSHKPRMIAVGDFDANELADVARQFLPDTVSNRISERVAAENGRAALTFATLATGVQGLQSKPISDEIFQAILHPLFWRFFSELNDEPMQHRALDGDGDIVQQLCRNYMDWFLQKAGQRNPDIDPSMIKPTLKSIAKLTSAKNQVFTCAPHWITTACNMGFGEAAADRLFREAKSFGLVKLTGPLFSSQGLCWSEGI
jgi:hypothetical protein